MIDEDYTVEAKAASIKPMGRHERERWLTDHGFVNVDAICGAAEKIGVEICRAAGLTVGESAKGLNIYGHEGSTATLYGQPVTEANYHNVYEIHLDEGVNGVGPGQLTDRALQEEADKLGGCWNAYYSLLICYRELHACIQRGGVQGGLSEYNGGPDWREVAAAIQYGKDQLANIARLEREGLH